MTDAADGTGASQPDRGRRPPGSPTSALAVAAGLRRRRLVPPLGRAAGERSRRSARSSSRPGSSVSRRGSARAVAPSSRSLALRAVRRRSWWPATACVCSSSGCSSRRSRRPARRVALHAAARSTRRPHATAPRPRHAVLHHEPAVRGREGRAVRPRAAVPRARHRTHRARPRRATCWHSPRTRSQRGADVIGMAGGDGSQALVASVASRHGVPVRRRPRRHPQPLRPRPGHRPGGRRRRAGRLRRRRRAARSTSPRSTGASS